MNQDDVFRLDRRARSSRSGRTSSAIDLHELYPSGRFPQMPFDESMAQVRQRQARPALRPRSTSTSPSCVIEHDGGGVPFWKEIADKFTSGAYRRDLPAEIVKALRHPGRARNLSRAELDKLEEFVKGMGAKGLARAKVDADGNWTQSPLAKTSHARAARARSTRRSAPRTATSSSSSSARSRWCTP